MSLGVLLKAFVNFILGIVVVVLGLRVTFRLFNANAANGFVNWVYNSSAEIMGPFRGIFPVVNVEGSVIDFSAIFAIFVYGLTGFFIVYLIDAAILASTERGRRK